MQTEIATTQATAAAPTPIVIDSAEAHLATEISALWESHSQARGELRKSRSELKQIRTNLSQRLHELKSVLSCRGRASQWSGFLVSNKIPRSTADRLCAGYEKSINPDGNSTSGAIQNLSDDGIAQVAKSTWARLQGKLGSHQAKYLFFAKLLIASGAPYETFDDGLLILLDPPPAQEADKDSGCFLPAPLARPSYQEFVEQG